MQDRVTSRLNGRDVRIPPGGSILVVEDHADARAMLVRVLRQWGYAATGAGDCCEAIELLGRSRPDAVLSDLNLGDATGFRLAEQVRQADAGVVDEVGADAPYLLAYSGFCDDVTLDQCRTAGFDAHVPKTGDLSLLRALLDGP